MATTVVQITLIVDRDVTQAELDSIARQVRVDQRALESYVSCSPPPPAVVPFVAPTTP